MNVEIAIPSLFNTKKKKRGENGTETQLGSSKFHQVHLSPTQLLSYTEVTQYYSDCRLIYLPPTCSLALVQSRNSGLDIAQAGTSWRQLRPSPLRGSPTATPLQQYRGSSSKSTQDTLRVFLSPQTLYSASRFT